MGRYTCCLGVVLSMLAFAGGCRLPSCEPVGRTLRKFQTRDGRWGFKDERGRVAIAPTFREVGRNWENGYVWVELGSCREDTAAQAKDENGVPRCADDILSSHGDFIDSQGRRLLNAHVHALVSEPIPCCMEPEFRHGLAFVRLYGEDVVCVRTNGLPIALHGEVGPFVNATGCHFFHEDWGDCAVVKVKGRGYGVLDAAGLLLGPPTNTFMQAYQTQTNRFFRAKVQSPNGP